MLMSNLRVSSPTIVSSRTSSRRRSFLFAFLLEALRAATVGITPDDAADERVEDDADEEEVAFRFEGPDAGRTSLSSARLSRVDLRDVAGMLLQMCTVDGRSDVSVARSICGRVGLKIDGRSDNVRDRGGDVCWSVVLHLFLSDAPMPPKREV